MTKHLINLFMWGYQEHFRISLESLAKNVFEHIGIECKPKVLLVGVLLTGKTNPNPVCVEPENKEWSISIFNNLQYLIESNTKNHHLKDIFYSDEQSMRDKPEIIKRSAISSSICDSLSQYDISNEVRSFCGKANIVGDYYVTPVIQVPESAFIKFPPLKDSEENDPFSFSGDRSFIHSCISCLLDNAFENLYHPEPGRNLSLGMRDAEEIARNAASYFMHTPGAATNKRYISSELFNVFNYISSLMYEGLEGKGKLILVEPENNAITFTLRLKDPVSLRKPRWVRKILQMATKDISLIANSDYIYGLGKLNSQHNPSIQDVFVIDFIDHYHWELKCNEQVLLASHYGNPKLPQQEISKERFITNYARLFPNTSLNEQAHIWNIFNTAIKQQHGSMIVVATDASEEAERLMQQGTLIEPTLMTEELFNCVSDIDGTIILNPHGICYAIGVILDGAATTDCTPSRGSRFNSGLRYVNAGEVNRLAIVISDDKTVDIIPLLKLQIKHTDIESNISLLEKATLDDYHVPRNWLDEHRFYLSNEQCNKVNIELDRIESLPREVGQFVILTNRFTLDPNMNNSYFFSE